MHDADALRTMSGDSPLLIRDRFRAQGWPYRWRRTAKCRSAQAVDAQVLMLRNIPHADCFVGGRGARCHGFAVLHRGSLSAVHGAFPFLSAVETGAVNLRQATHSTANPTVLSASSPIEVHSLAWPAKVRVLEIGNRCIT